MDDTQHNHGVTGRVVFVNHDVRCNDADANLRAKRRAERAAIGIIRQAVKEFFKGSNVSGRKSIPGLAREISDDPPNVRICWRCEENLRH